MNRPMPMVHTWTIETAPAHLRGFAYQHPLEFETSQVERRGSELWHVGMTGIETYELENNAVFGPTPIIIDVTSVKKLLARRLIPYQMIRLDLTQEWVDYITETCNIEDEGVERHDMEACLRPGILVEWMQFTTSTIDGAHRLVKSWRLGLKHFEMAMVLAPWIIGHVVRKGAEEALFKANRQLQRDIENGLK